MGGVGGGASIGLTKNAVVIGIWEKDALAVKIKDSKKENQNSGDCEMNVEKVVKLLTDLNY